MRISDWSSDVCSSDLGDIYQLVADQNRAWHAGPGRWGTITDVNSASIGIELDNDGAEPFAPAQIDSLLRLLDDLCTRYNIPRTAIVAHADFAPTRKRDPGFRFPWKQLADAGFGLWPDEPLADPPPGFDPRSEEHTSELQSLMRISYAVFCLKKKK